jgi:hypothetical protein
MGRRRKFNGGRRKKNASEKDWRQWKEEQSATEQSNSHSSMHIGGDGSGSGSGSESGSVSESEAVPLFSAQDLAPLLSAQKSKYTVLETAYKGVLLAKNKLVRAYKRRKEQLAKRRADANMLKDQLGKEKRVKNKLQHLNEALVEKDTGAPHVAMIGSFKEDTPACVCGGAALR